MRNENKIKGLTVVELLTVLAVMALLISLLLPAVSIVMNMANTTKQKAQFTTISIALESFRNDFGDYPESSMSSANDYCGAQKLSEAMVGYDLFGFHPNSEFKSDGKWTTGPTPQEYTATDAVNLKARKGPYIEAEKAGAIRLGDGTGGKKGLYSGLSLPNLASDTFVLADSYKRTYNFDIDGDGKSDTVKSGMPILYYKARANKYKLDRGTQDDSIFDFRHNKDIVNGDVPWDKTKSHELDEDIFYDTDSGNDTTSMKYITNPALTNGTNKIPYNKGSFILISAGKDGLYGTNDDIFNFEK